MRKILIVLGILVMCTSIIARGPLEGEPGKVVVMTWDNDDANYSVLGDQPIIDYVEKELNLEIEWQLFPHAERSTAVVMMIAAGGEMPDLFPTFLSAEITPRSLAERDVIIPWSDLFREARDIKKKFDAPHMAGVKHQMTDNETGKIYALPYTNFNPLLVWTDYLRGDWMDDLGLKTPETNQDLYNVLKAFKTRDPNGNGKADEIPWQNFYSGVNWMKMFSRNFGIPFPDYSMSTLDSFYWASVDKEEIVYSPTHPRFKTMLEFLNKLWEEELINQEQFNMDSPKFNATVSNNTLGMQNMWPSAILGMQEQVRKLDPDATWQAIPYPIDLRVMSSDDRVYAFLGPVGIGWLLAKNGKNTENAVRLMNYVFGDEDFQFTAEFGIEGTHHAIVDGNPQYIGKWAEMDAIARFSAMGSHVGRLPIQKWNYGVRGKIDTDAIYAPHRAYISDIDQYIKPATIWKLKSEQWKMIGVPDIKTFVDESVAKFVIGTKPFSEWDSYVETVNKQAGDQLEAATAMLQEYFDNYVKASY